MYNISMYEKITIAAHNSTDTYIFGCIQNSSHLGISLAKKKCDF